MAAAAFCLMFLAVSNAAAAEAKAKSPETSTVHWSVVASGGGQTSLGSLTLGCTLGQTAVGAANLGGGTVNTGFWQNFTRVSCCLSRVGDANGSGQDEPTIGDISVMIEAKFITLSCVGLIDCIAEGDVNQSGGLNPTCDDISISDISILIDYLFVSLPYKYGPLPECP